MSSSRTERFGDWLGLTGAESPSGSPGDSTSVRRASLATRIGFLAAWAAIAVVVFVYLQMSATGEDGLGGYLPLVTAGLVFSTGSLLTQSALAHSEHRGSEYGE
ncbi:hypothetical protein [Nesterenkonia halotolerans]|uniref:Uncharacterized protein n=1 Tax=Nesterenkonia halotolerans TaxID=225325 RepID=A0ABR9J511_9MICC|nr:hypothetical protein [Nesterenkonia halotolerans]MBE1514084.1 hypothetical protein [Nesterenkonia halotolerans]